MTFVQLSHSDRIRPIADTMILSEGHAIGRRQVKFDWIDFGCRKQVHPEVTSSFDKWMHTSTACLLAKFLRRRDAPYRKVFCWLRSDEGVFEAKPPSESGVIWIEATFPFAEYDAPGADKLRVFATWLVDTLARGAPELGIDAAEAESLKERLVDQHYVYVRTDKLKRVAGAPFCEVDYIHTPKEVGVEIRRRTKSGTVSRRLEHHPFLRDELLYGWAISELIQTDDGQLLAKSYDGLL